MGEVKISTDASLNVRRVIAQKFKTMAPAPVRPLTTTYKKKKTEMNNSGDPCATETISSKLRPKSFRAARFPKGLIFFPQIMTITSNVQHIEARRNVSSLYVWGWRKRKKGRIARSKTSPHIIQSTPQRVMSYKAGIPRLLVTFINVDMQEKQSAERATRKKPSIGFCPSLMPTKCCDPTFI